jgi:hypothetical protein
MSTTKFTLPVSVSKIAFLNPYLPGGHMQTAEIECTAKFIRAAHNLGIDVKVFASCEEIEYYAPDMVISLSFQTPKLTAYPTYVIQDVPVSMMRDVPRFIRNLLTYDGYLAISPTVTTWLAELCAKHNKKAHIANAALFSVPDSAFQPGNFTNASAMYIGTNWDGSRHQNLFKELSSGEYVKCYGPAKGWANYPESVYAGTIPFDGFTVAQTYHRHGAGLCIAHPQFEEENIPSSRTFEIAAASALPICSRIPLTESLYGDSVLYIDHHLPTAELAQSIVEHVKWIRSNPHKAQEMTRSAHAVFSNALTLEHYIIEVIKMHERVLTANNYITPEKPALAFKSIQQPKVTYIVAAPFADYRVQPVLNSIMAQSYSNIEVILLTQNEGPTLKSELASLYKDKLSIKVMPYSGRETNSSIFTFLKNNATQWLGILTPQDRIFPNHCSGLIEMHQNKNSSAVGLAAGSLEFTDNFHLPETMQDPHNIVSESKIRVSQAPATDNALALHAMLVNLSVVQEAFFDEIDFYHLQGSELAKSMQVLGEFNQISEITTAVNIEKQIIQQKITTFEQMDIGKLKSDYTRLQHKLETLEQERKSLYGKVVEQDMEINDMLMSFSWRSTAGLRKIKPMLRYLFKRSRVTN